MTISKKFIAFCTAAALLASSGCQSPEIAPASPETSSVYETSGSANVQDSSESMTTALSGETETTTTAGTMSGEDVVIFTTAVTTGNSAAAGMPSDTLSEPVPTTASSVLPAQTTTKAAGTTKAVTSSSVSAETTTAAVTAAPEVIPDNINLKLLCDDDTITASTKHITMEISYSGDENAYLYTGKSYELEKLVDGEWVVVPFADGVYWEDIAYEVSRNSSPKIDISLEDELYKEAINAGDYRVVKKLSGISGNSFEVYTEFEVEEGGENSVLVETNGSYTLSVDEIREDRFVCEFVFPYPNVYYVMCDTAKYPDICVGDNIEVYYSEVYWLSDEYYRVIPTYIEYSNYELDPDVDYKPVIYLYPETTTEVAVKLDYNGTLTLTDPEYRNGWIVTASPDGTIRSEGREYPYLFWEGRKNYALNTTSGFCVSGSDTKSFLEEKLAYLGLNERETEEFIGFWLPYMENNRYNVITFAGEDYRANAALAIKPSPDTVIRVFMTYTAADEYVDIPEQRLEAAPERNGFTVVEWGGSIY